MKMQTSSVFVASFFLHPLTFLSHFKHRRTKNDKEKKEKNENKFYAAFHLLANNRAPPSRHSPLGVLDATRGCTQPQGVEGELPATSTSTPLSRHSTPSTPLGDLHFHLHWPPFFCVCAAPLLSLMLLFLARFYFASLLLLLLL
uniref:Uncharacterized protein n=1 Tax=Trypanosoma congolense (strain IL3000) TaxID=1068625 RepID=G0UZJ4_TRYCI|nr:hypothetical protein, unlikely [Trypanosoma congolense IL3000]